MQKYIGDYFLRVIKDNSLIRTKLQKYWLKSIKNDRNRRCFNKNVQQTFPFSWVFAIIMYLHKGMYSYQIKLINVQALSSGMFY